jgi:WD40 repeat protein
LETAFVQHSVARRAAVLQRIVGITLGVIIALSSLTLFAFDRQQAATNNANDLAAEVVVRSTAQSVAVTREAEAVAAQATAVAEASARATQEAVAIAQRDLARSRELAVVAQGQLDDDPEEALLIAIAANKITRTFESEAALRTALQASPVRSRFAQAGKAVQAAAFAPHGDQLLITGMAAGAPFAHLLDFPALTTKLTLPTVEGYYPTTNGFSPQGTYLWVVYDDRTLQIWDAERGTTVLTAPAPVVGWFPDESRIVTANAADDSLLQIWDLRLGKVLSTLGEPGPETANPRLIQVTPDQQQVVLVSWPDSDFAVTAWDLQSGAQITHFTVDPSIAFSPDGGVMAYGQHEAVVLRDTVRQTVIMSMTQHTADVYQTVFSPDGRYLASAAGDNSVYVWQIADEPPNAALIPAFSVPTSGDTQLAFAPDRPLLLTWDDRNGLLAGWSTQTKSTQIATLATGQRIQQLSFAPQGGYFVTVDDDGALRTWNTNFGEEWVNVPPLPQFTTTGMASAHLSPDSKTLAVTVDNQLRFFDVTTRTWLTTTLTMTQSVRNFTFTPDGAQLVAYGESALAWWNVAGGELLGTLSTVSATVSSAVLDPIGQYGAATLAVREPNPEIGNEVRQTVVLWQSATRQWRPLADIPHYRAVETLSFAPDGATLLVVGSTAVNEAGANHLVRVWDVVTGQLRFAQDFGPETAVQYLPDGRHLLIVRREELSLWDIQGGSQLARMIPESPLSTRTMSITADGRRFVLPDGFSSTARVWDLSTLRPLFSLIGHEPNSTITTVQFSNDGQLILTASSGDNTMRLWDGESGALLSVLPYASEHELSTDGRFVMSKSGFGLPSLYLARFADLLTLAQSRSTRRLTCEERRDFLHEAVVCPVATPIPVAS